MNWKIEIWDILIKYRTLAQLKSKWSGLMVPMKLIKVLGITCSLDFPFQWALVIATYHSIRINFLCQNSPDPKY